MNSGQDVLAILGECIREQFLRLPDNPRYALVLIIDDVPSTTIWTSLVQGLVNLLEQQPVFKTVRTFSMDTSDPNTIYLWNRVYRHQHNTVTLNHVIDPQDHTLMLLISDCTAPAWYSGQVVELLDTWQKQVFISLLQLLPPSWWDSTALVNAAEVILGTSHITRTNGDLRSTLRHEWRYTHGFEGIDIPILSLSPHSFTMWASLVIGLSNPYMAGVRLQRGLMLNNQSLSVDPEQLFTQFEQESSPAAWRLAGALAALPTITIALAQVIQEKVLQDFEPLHLAEVLLSGILKPRSVSIGEDSIINSDQTLYDMDLAIRESILLAAPDLLIQRSLAIYLQYATNKGGNRALRAIQTGDLDPGDMDALSIEPYIAETSARIFNRLDHPSTADQIREHLLQRKLDSARISLQTSQMKPALVKTVMPMGMDIPFSISDLTQIQVLLATLNREQHWQLTQTEQERYLQQLKPFLLDSMSEQRLKSLLVNYHYDHAIVAKFQTGQGFDQDDWMEWRHTVRTVLAKNGLDWSSQIATSREDLVQIALKGLLEALPSYTYHSRFKTWAYKVFLRSVLQHLRIFQVSKRTGETLSLNPTIDDQAGLQVADSRAPDPADQMLANTLQSLIYRVLQQHSDQRLPEIFRLAKEVDLTITEIGQRFQLSPGRISDLLKQARRLLQQHPTIRDWYNPDLSPDESFS